MSRGVGLPHRGLRDECLPADSRQILEGDCRAHRRSRYVRTQRRPQHRGGRVQRLRGPGLQADRECRTNTPLLSKLENPDLKSCAAALIYLFRSAFRKRHEHAGGEDQEVGQEGSS